MKRPRVRLRRLVPLAFVLLPPLFWTLVLTITPTEWARTRIVAQLSKASGRPIRLAHLRIGVLGGVELANLEIGAPGGGADPWLKAASARINVSVLQLLAGQVQPSEIRVNGLTLRVLRRSDGTLELADLLRAGPAEADDANSGSCEPAGLELWLSDGRVTIIDEPSETRLELAGVEGHATLQGRQASLHALRGTLNGGPFELAASIDRTHAEPSFEGKFHAHRVAVNEGSNLLPYLVPVLSGTSEADSADARLALSVYVRGQGKSREALRRSLVGQGSIGLDPVVLEGSRLLTEVDHLIDLPSQVLAGSVKSDFVIKNGRVSTENLTLNIGDLPIVLAGWTDFDGVLDYRVRPEALTSRLPGKAREFLSDLSIDLNDISALHVTGTLDAMQVSFDEGAAELAGRRGDPGRRGDDRVKLRNIGRRLKDRLLR
jgi:uncharacterized protein involved in outer membrane biogenesis